MVLPPLSLSSLQTVGGGCDGLGETDGSSQNEVRRSVQGQYPRIPSTEAVAGAVVIGKGKSAY